MSVSTNKRCVTLQKFESPTYTAVEAWNYTNPLPCFAVPDFCLLGLLEPEEDVTASQVSVNIYHSILRNVPQDINQSVVPGCW